MIAAQAANVDSEILCGPVAPPTVRWSFVSIALAALALTSCVQETLPPAKVAVPATASEEDLRWVIEAALALHNWKVVERAPGSMNAYVRSQGSGEEATIQIAYRPGAVHIRSVKSTVSRQRYDRWVHLLSIEIQKNAALLGSRRPPAPSSPPPPPPPDDGSPRPPEHPAED